MKQWNRQLLAACLLGTAMAMSAMAAAQDTGVSSHPMIGEAAPAFDLEEVGGGRLSLESLRGRYIVIHFGTSW